MTTLSNQRVESAQHATQPDATPLERIDAGRSARRG